MQRLLDVTSSYGAKNADKTNYLLFNAKISAFKEATDNDLILKLFLQPTCSQLYASLRSKEAHENCVLK